MYDWFFYIEFTIKMARMVISIYTFFSLFFFAQVSKTLRASN